MNKNLNILHLLRFEILFKKISLVCPPIFMEVQRKITEVNCLTAFIYMINNQYDLLLINWIHLRFKD